MIGGNRTEADFFGMQTGTAHRYTSNVDQPPIPDLQGLIVLCRACAWPGIARNMTMSHRGAPWTRDLRRAARSPSLRHRV